MQIGTKSKLTFHTLQTFANEREIHQRREKQTTHICFLSEPAVTFCNREISIALQLESDGR